MEIPTLDDKIQFILLSYKCLGTFNFRIGSFIIHGFRGDGEYSGFNGLFVYNLLSNKIIVNNYYIADRDLYSVLREVFEKAV